MSMFKPIMVQLNWGGEMSFQNGWLSGVSAMPCRCSFPILTRINFATLYDMLFQVLRTVDRESYNLKLILWYEFQGMVFKNEVFDDTTLETIYYLSQECPQYMAQFEVLFEQRYPTQQSGFMDILRNVEQSSQFVQSQVLSPSASHRSVEVESEDEYEEAYRRYDAEQHAAEDAFGDDDDVGDGIHSSSDESVDRFSNEESMSEDEGVLTVQPSSSNQFVSRFGNLIQQAETSNIGVFDEEAEHGWDCWSEEHPYVIRKGMVFKNKRELLGAVRDWHIKFSKEMIMKDTRPCYVTAGCFTEGPNYKGTIDGRPCEWSFSASNRNPQKVWRIFKWDDQHTCLNNLPGNNNRSLTSTIIANEIISQVQKNIGYAVKHIQADVKKKWSVDITYGKGWNSRRIAIERLYGTWESNLAELPKYINELLRSNPETVVSMENGPQVGQFAYQFKYIFWAFDPAIKCFQSCIPVVFVDGTHLRGNYIGKLLTAVGKNANGQILPIAFAIVDQETNASWKWFLDEFKTHVASKSKRKLCIISDRHKGIINAMENIGDGFAHRFCLRHIRSNLNRHMQNQELRKLCWKTGAATEQNSYVTGLRDIRAVSEKGYQYLMKAKPELWALYRDQGLRRWGNTTTNIAESLNNVLRVPRRMPIKACIEYTFDYTRQHFIQQHEDAMKCKSHFSKRMWKCYIVREERAKTYTPTVYDQEQGVYNVHSTYQTSGDGANEFIVRFLDQTCTCGKWQQQRFPCSHAIAVCRLRGQTVKASNMVANVYKTKRWRNQYKYHFNPLRDECYWEETPLTLRVDPDKLITDVGRRKTRRIENEMDQRLENGRRPNRCSICNSRDHTCIRCPRKLDIHDDE